ncbi:MAG: MarR family transcriptional regulator, partial [Euryarchaeota archaeon]|nr:MarR family transcriptional regulator [Euryarchaeota archaeon]
NSKLDKALSTPERIPGDLQQKILSIFNNSPEATTQDMAQQLNLSRAYTSSWLNKMVKIGALQKARKGRRIVFQRVQASAQVPTQPTAQNTPSN